MKHYKVLDYRYIRNLDTWCHVCQSSDSEETELIMIKLDKEERFKNLSPHDLVGKTISVDFDYTYPYISIATSDKIEYDPNSDVDIFHFNFRDVGIEPKVEVALICPFCGAIKIGKENKQTKCKNCGAFFNQVGSIGLEE